MSEVIERMKYILSMREVNISQASERMGINQANLSSILNQKRGLGNNMIDKFCISFDISKEWLLTGEGEMTTGTEHEKRYNQPIRRETSEINLNTEGRTIRYYDIEASATPTEMYDLSSNIKYRDIVVPGFGDCEIAVNVWGDSMEPILHSGEIVLMKEWRERFIEYGQIYMIVTRGNHRMIKYIRPGMKPETISCESENKYYSPVEIEKEEIVKMYLVKGRISRNAI